MPIWYFFLLIKLYSIFFNFYVCLYICIENNCIPNKVAVSSVSLQSCGLFVCDARADVLLGVVCADVRESYDARVAPLLCCLYRPVHRRPRARHRSFCEAACTTAQGLFVHYCCTRRSFVSELLLPFTYCLCLSRFYCLCRERLLFFYFKSLGKHRRTRG